MDDVHTYKMVVFLSDETQVYNFTYYDLIEDIGEALHKLLVELITRCLNSDTENKRLNFRIRSGDKLRFREIDVNCIRDWIDRNLLDAYVKNLIESLTFIE